MSLTGQLRLFEADELPAQYDLKASKGRGVTYALIALISVAVAAGGTLLVLRSQRETAPTRGSIVVESTPAGAQVTVDGERVPGVTPLTVPDLPVGSSHKIVLALPRYRPYTEEVIVPKRGGDVQIKAVLGVVTGKLSINSQPGGADIVINGQVRGRTPTTLPDLDMTAVRKLELRLKDHQPFIQDLSWPDDGQLQIDAKLKR